MYRLGRGLRQFADGIKPPKAHGEMAVVSGSMLASAELEAAFTNPSKLTYAQIKEIRWDETVFGVESALFATCLRKGWVVEPPEDDLGDTRGMAAELDWAFRLTKGTFRKRLREIVGTAYRMGHSETERVLVTPEGNPNVVESEWGQRLVFTLKTRDAETFRYYTDTHGNLLPYAPPKSGLVQIAGTDEVPLDPADFILYAWMPELDNPYGNTAYRPVYRDWFYKKWMHKFNATYAERKAGGILLLKAKAGYDKEAHEAGAKAFLAGIQSDSEGIIPEDLMELQIVEPDGRGADIFRANILMYNLGIAVGLLAPEQLGMTKTEGGSYAKGKDQHGFWLGIVEDLAAEMEELVNEQIVPQYGERNWPPQHRKKLPMFKLNPIVEEDKWALLESVYKAVQIGAMPLSNALKDWLAQKLGAPEIPDEFKTTGTTTSTGADGDAGGDGEQGGADDTGGNGGDRGADGEPAAEAPQFSGFPRRIFADRSFPRALTRFERHVKFAEIRDRWDNIEESTVETVTGVIDDALTDWLGRVEKLIALGNTAKGRRAVRKLGLKGEAKIRQTAKSALAMSHLFGKYDVRGEAQRATGKKFAQAAKFADAGSLYLIPRDAQRFLRGLTIGSDALGIIGETAFDVAGVISDDVLHDVHRILLDALDHRDSGRARRELREALRGYVSERGPYGGQVVDDAVLTPHRIKTIVRTNLATAYNKGRMAQLRDPDVDSVITAYQWSAILDDDTTDYCAAMDGRVFDKDEIQEPPAHHQCRSFLVPIFVGEQYTKTTQADVRDELRKAAVKDRKVAWREKPIDPDRIVRGKGFGG